MIRCDLLWFGIASLPQAPGVVLVGRAELSPRQMGEETWLASLAARNAASNRRAESAASASGVPANPMTSPDIRGFPA